MGGARLRSPLMSVANRPLSREQILSRMQQEAGLFTRRKRAVAEKLLT